MADQQVPASWYQDPNTPGQLRWWDGTAWTEHTHQPVPVPPTPARAVTWSAAWYPDTNRPGYERWWDGAAWTAASRIVESQGAQARPPSAIAGSTSPTTTAATANTSPTVGAHQAKPAVAVVVTKAPTAVTPTEKRGWLARRTSTPAGPWIPVGQTVVVAGLTLAGGMLYVAKQLPAANGRSVDPALINPSLPVDSRRPDWDAKSVPYWPSYSQITPGARAAYLNWLAGGRTARPVAISYVFLFFYGLERRALIDRNVASADAAELDAIRQEVERLIALYGSNHSFHSYASGFQSLLRTMTSSTSPTKPPVRTDDRWSVPMGLKLGLGEMARTSTPVPADWALTWAHYNPEIILRTPAVRCADEFAALFQARYVTKHGPGLTIKPGKTTLRLDYQPASAGLSPVRWDLGVPDVFSQAAPTRALGAIVDDCTRSLEAYSRFLGRRPDGRGSLAAVALLPPELAATAGGELNSLIAFVDAKLAGGPTAVFDAAEILAFWPVKPGTKFAKADAVAVAQLLGARGVGIEPDVRLGGPTLAAGSPAVLFRAGPSQPTAVSAEYAASAVLIQLAATVSAADGHIHDAEVAALHTQVEAAPGLSLAERLRLRAHVDWLLAGPLKLNGMGKRLAALGSEQRETIADFATSVATADGVVTPAEITTLTAIFKLLGLDASSVYSRVHASTTGTSSGPVTVRPGTPGPPGHTIPQPPTSPAGELVQPVVLDLAVVAAKMVETAEVSTLLSSIFSDDEPVEAPLALPSDMRTYAGLDGPHSALLQSLAARASWTRPELEAECGALGLMPDGALDALNEAAYDVTGDPVTDGDDPVMIDAHVAQEMLK
jgi:tellurite resistance protein